MARASYTRVASALLAVGMAVLVSTACGSVGLMGDEPAPAGSPRPAGETQVITVEVGPKDGRLDAAVRTKRPGEDVELTDARAEAGKAATPRTSDTAGTIAAWENWPTPTPVPLASAQPEEPAERVPAGTQAKRQPTPVPTPSKPVGAARAANARQ